MALLEIKDISVAYGGIQALQGVSIHVDKGEIVTIIGANGAGKSSLLNAISSMVPYHKGEIVYQGERLSDKPYKVVAQGIIQVPEGRQVFANLNVEENLRIGAYLPYLVAAAGAGVDYPTLDSAHAGAPRAGDEPLLAVFRRAAATAADRDYPREDDALADSIDRTVEEELKQQGLLPRLWQSAVDARQP